MRPGYIVSLALAVTVVALGTWSFYTNVVNPHGNGEVMEGMVMAGDAAASSSPAATTQSPPSAQTAEEAGGGDAVVPRALAGLPLTALESGDEALIAVEQLHGKALGTGLDAAWVAHYGDAGQATLWVSRSANPQDAQVLFVRMTDKIAEGNSPFSGSKPMSGAELEGYELDGMGQKHYYFVAGADLYWLAVAPDLAQPALAELVESAVAVPAGG